MRSSLVVLILVSALSVPARAASVDDKIFDQQSIDALELRASQAQPQEQCFLYAQLVHQMVEFSAQQYAAGDIDKASGLLKRAQQFTRKIQTAVALNNKKLKDAQILLRHTAFRLSEMLHASSLDDRPLVAETLAQLNDAQNQTMLEVFRK